MMLMRAALSALESRTVAIVELMEAAVDAASSEIVAALMVSRPSVVVAMSAWRCQTP